MKHPILTFAAMFFGFCISLSAQATANFKASVTIIQPVGITTTQDMDFASLDARTGGEVTLTPSNQRLSTGGVALVDGGMVSAATFEVTGQPGFTFSVSLPESNYVLSNGSESIIIKNFTNSKAGSNILEGGSSTISVGATLEVQPEQQPGIYRSTQPLAVTVNYN